MSDIVIEIPKGSKHKYEMKKGKLFLDRLLSIPVPYSYGYVEGTLAEDGDPLDVFVVTKEPLVPGSRLRIDMVADAALIRCVDNGVQDDKIVILLDKDILLPFKKLHAVGKCVSYLKRYKEGFEVQSANLNSSIALKKVNECMKEASSGR